MCVGLAWLLWVVGRSWRIPPRTDRQQRDLDEDAAGIDGVGRSRSACAIQRAQCMLGPAFHFVALLVLLI